MLLGNSVDKKLVIDHLRKLGNKKISPINDYTGICHELDLKFGIAEHRLIDYFRKWLKYSGDSKFPIKIYHRHPQFSYIEIRDKWRKTKYSELRLELCLFLADEIEKEL